MARLKLFTRLAKLKGKYNAFMNSSTSTTAANKQLTLDEELNNQLTNDDDDDDDDNDVNTNDGDMDDIGSDGLLLVKKSNHNNNNNNKKKVSTDDYTCTCCFEILYNPISLLCGHNICQLCLSNWFLISSKRICPTCRQEWVGSPKVNLVLKNTIEKLFPKHIKIRKMNVDEKVVRETQEKFEKKCKQVNYALNDDNGLNGQNINNPQQQQGFLNNIRNPNRLVKYTILSFLSGLLIGITICASILLGFFFLWYLNNTYSTNSIVNKYMKPTYQWNEKETYEWLQQLGPWSLMQIAPAAHKIRLNGTGLLDLNEGQLINEPFNLNETFYRELLIDSINALKYRSSIPMPSIWEFKNAYRFKVIFSTIVFDSFPRFTLFGIYYFDFNLFNGIKNIIENGFSNFDSSNYGSNLNTISLTTPSQSSSPSPSSSSSLFMFYAIQFPYIYLKSLLKECFSETNQYTIFLLTLNCYILTAIEICRKYNFIKAIFHRKFLMYVKKTLTSYMKQFSIYLLLIIFWFILPTFLYDCIFVFFIYFKIFFNSFILYRFLKRFSYLIILNYF